MIRERQPPDPIHGLINHFGCVWHLVGLAAIVLFGLIRELVAWLTSK